MVRQAECFWLPEPQLPSEGFRKSVFLGIPYFLQGLRRPHAPFPVRLARINSRSPSITRLDFALPSNTWLTMECVTPITFAASVRVMSKRRRAMRIEKGERGSGFSFV